MGLAGVGGAKYGMDHPRLPGSGWGKGWMWSRHGWNDLA
ncbi:hypothetical protein SACS_1335 [Parasaccharibacter apium]|uniref:Uncharacterized protein n=1 Tax=Parasaccharibacter apium TaxID=1510841 RepID=A0A7U7G6M5_9PROT|nr:hypothetical protein SACS_1335 [Parasaccharibacter apium]